VGGAKPETDPQWQSSVEPVYLNDASKYSTLNAALAVPLEVCRLVGVVALYHAEKDFFTFDHLRILLAVSRRWRWPSRTR